MQNSTSQDRYSKPAVFFHWAVFLLVALAYLAIEIRGPKGSDSRIFWNGVHYWAGTLVLTFAVFRLVWRLWRGAPNEIEVNPVLTFLARLAHVALYLFIFVQPLLGILTLNTGGHPLTLAGLNVEITLVGTDTIARHAIKSAHEWIGNAFYFVIGLHALGALMHHVVFRDRTLRRML
ncbi:cytochrome b [Paraburkholderia gardini]|uniref:Cytochrome b561 n=1 Tax=Paraburkholderia gardini TaxID=2823469 RepID=A0ABM8U7X8_9BURK|nr:cytochrome b [Paraburkholderia gardini]CAG4914013.1 Cytochrome b561 [Paraburkholderia gardini]